MPRARDLTADVDIDVAGLFAEVWRKRWLVLALTLLAGAAVFALALSVDPRYEASTRILIERRAAPLTGPAADGVSDESRFDEQAIGSQVQVLTSDDIALKVIATLGLDRTEEFGAGRSRLGVLLALFGLGSEPAAVSSAERSLKAFKQHLTVYAARGSRVLVVEFWSRDPELAQAVPNAVADEYLRLTKEAKVEANAEAAQWLGPEIDDLRQKVRAAEARVAEFRASSDILDATNNALLATQQLTEVSTQLSQLRAQVSAAEAKAATIQAALDSGASLDAVPEVIASPLIQRLRERQVSLQAEISDLSTTLLPNHPRIRALRSQLADFERQITGEARNILRSLQNSADVLRRQEAVLEREVDRLKAEAARVGGAEVELRALEREAAAQRDLLQTYLTRYREAAGRQASEFLPVDARVISRAVRPIEPYFPKTVPMAATGMVTMLVLAIVGILTWALMTGKAFRPVGTLEDDLIPERLTIPEAPATVERPRAAEPAPARLPDVVFEKPSGSPAEYAEAGEGLAQVAPPPLDGGSGAMAEADEPARAAPEPGADAELFAFGHACEAIENLGRARVAVVSPAGDPGSLTAWMLARRLARRGRSVAVVDLTGSGVTSREMLGEGVMAGLRELLAGRIRFGEAVRRDRLTSAHVLAAGGGDVDPAEIDLGRLAGVIDAVADTYDFQVYDCGYAGADALKLVADIDTVIIVSSEGASPAEAAAMVDELADAGFTEAILVHLDPADRETALAGAA